MKKNILIGLAGVALLSLSSVNMSNDVTQVSATTIRVGKINRLQRNAYIYNARGKRIKVASLKRGRNIKVLSKKIIKGKTYAKIGKNQYIKLANFSKFSASNKPTGLLKHNAYVFDKNGKRVHKPSLKKDKIVTLYGTRYIKGKKYYQIGKNRFIKASNVADSIPIVSDNNESNNNSTVSHNTQINGSSVANANNNVTNSTSTGSSNRTSVAASGNVSKTSSDVASQSNKNKDENKLNDIPAVDPYQKKQQELEQAREESVNTNRVTDEDKRLNQPTIDGPYTADATLLHDGFIYDENGQHIPGKYVYKDLSGKFKPVWTRLGYKVINGHKYYLIQYNTPKNYYVKYDVFAKNGKDENPKPLTSKQLAAARQFLQDADYIWKARGDEYSLSSYADRNNYDGACLYLNQLLSQKKYSESDVEALEAKVIEAKRKLNGKRLEFNGTPDQLNEKQRQEIINFVNKVEGSKDAGFLAKDINTIEYTSPTFDTQMKSSIYEYVKFINNKK